MSILDVQVRAGHQVLLALRDGAPSHLGQVLEQLQALEERLAICLLRVQLEADQAVGCARQARARRRDLRLLRRARAHVGHSALEMGRVLGGKREAHAQVLHIGHRHVQLGVERLEAHGRVHVVVLCEDLNGALLLVGSHAVPEGGEQRIRVAYDLLLEALPALQRVLNALAPVGERDSVVRVEVDLLERVDPRVGVELEHRRQADVHQVPAVDHHLAQLAHRAQVAERRVHALLVRLGH
eukprot:5011507-Prymnesium_polylepis.3